jgi:hypothetical protein
MHYELEQLTRPISQLTREDLTEEGIQAGLEILDEAFDALGALNAAYGDCEWDALIDYDERLMAVIEPLTRAVGLLKVHKPLG